MQQKKENRVQSLLKQPVKLFSEYELDILFTTLYGYGVTSVNSKYLICNPDGSGIEYLNGEITLGGLIHKYRVINEKRIQAKTAANIKRKFTNLFEVK